MMRRRAFTIIGGFLAFSIFFLGFYQSPILPIWRNRSGLIPDRTGSDWIGKGPEAEDKVLVLAKTVNETVDWVTDQLHDWQHAIYHMDDPDYILHPPRNVGREAMAYLTFLIDHYHNLPEIMVFLHPHLEGWPEAWHTDARDYNNVNSVRSLRLDYVRAHGYANMRCIPDPGCPSEIQPFRGDPNRTTEIAYVDAYTYFFGVDESSVPEQVGTPCCSQFAVSKTQVQTRPQSDYLRYRRWLLETELSSNVSGRVMEYMWHIIFGKDPVWCPELHRCWCEQFGRC